MFWVIDLNLKLDQSGVSKATHVWHKSLPQFLFLQIKKRNTTKLSGFNDNYNLHMIYIISTPLHTSTFSIKHLF